MTFRNATCSKLSRPRRLRESYSRSTYLGGLQLPIETVENFYRRVPEIMKEYRIVIDGKDENEIVMAIVLYYLYDCLL